MFGHLHLYNLLFLFLPVDLVKLEELMALSGALRSELGHCDIPTDCLLSRTVAVRPRGKCLQEKALLRTLVWTRYCAGINAGHLDLLVK